MFRRHTILTSMMLLAAMSCNDPSDANSGPDDPQDMQPDATMEDMSVMDASKDTGEMDTPDGCVFGTETEPGVVLTTAGLVQGNEDEQGSWSFLGIPYAQAPVGALRWKPTEPVTCYETQPLEAKAFGSPCTQRDFFGRASGSEDCLTLNVWTPSSYHNSAKKRPVLFFIHGGANVFGSTSEKIDDLPAYLYDGSHVAGTRDAIVVTIQYRLGPLGFLALPGMGEGAGNFAHLDQIEALRWVQHNIDAFGGDPDRVMIFGESAGGFNVCALIASPEASGLFSSALMQSGSCNARPLESVQGLHGEAVTEAKLCQGEPDLLSCLRAQSDRDLVKKLPGNDALLGDTSEAFYGSVVDGEVLRAAPLESISRGEHNEVPFIVGSNLDEADIPLLLPAIETEEEWAGFVAQMTSGLDEGATMRVLQAYPLSSFESGKKAAAALLTDVLFTCPARAAARAAATGQEKPVYQFVFSRRVTTSAGEVIPAFHTRGLRYMFGSLRSAEEGTSAEDLALSEAMIDMLVSFADTGVPRSDAFPMWPAYTPDTGFYMDFDETNTVKEQFRESRCLAFYPMP